MAQKVTTQEVATVQDVIALASALSPADKARLIERVAAELQQEVALQPTPRRSLYGALADLGPAPSAEEIDEARREAWANFPREDV